MVDAYLLLASRGSLPIAEARRKAWEAAARAVELDPDLAEARAAVGQFHVYAAPYDFAKGESELRRAIDLSPSSAIAHQFLGVALVEQGRLAEGIEAWNAARDLDPLSPFMPHLLAYAQLLRRDYAAALTEQRQANQLGPPFSIPVEVEIYIQNAALDEALVELDRVTPGREHEPNMRYCRALIYAAHGRRPEALAIVRELEEATAANMSVANLVGRIYLALGDRDRALEWMTRAFEAGGIFIFWKDAPLFDPIRKDRRFVELLGKMRLPTGN
jgi:tetratricopeptide (TPR) repeat protein